MERNVICVTELNEVMNCSKSEKDNLYVGLCGTQYVGSDRYPVVITEVISPKSVRVCWLEDIDFEHNLLKDKNDNDYIKVIGNYVHLNKDLTKIEPNGKVFKLRKNGSSTWGLLFGEKTHQEDQRPSSIERFLLSIWARLFH